MFKHGRAFAFFGASCISSTIVIVVALVLILTGCRCPERYEPHRVPREYIGDVTDAPRPLKTSVSAKLTNLEKGKPDLEVSFNLTR